MNSQRQITTAWPTYCVVALLTLLGLLYGSQQPALALPQGGTNFDPPIPERPRLSLRSKGETSISLNLRCGLGQNILYKKEASGTYKPFKTLTTCPNFLTDSMLTPGTQYTYKLEATADGEKYSSSISATTLYARVSFAQLVITPTESARVLAAFDWHKTDPLATGLATQPSLYYMNILLDDALAPQALREMGVHVESSPIFPHELNGWQDATALVTREGQVTGRWYFAVVPGAIYNTIRSESLKALQAGEEPAFAAVVFRRIPVQQAQELWEDRHRLSYTYLGAQGFEYNAIPRCQVIDGLRVCETQQQLLGWLAQKIFTFVVGAFDSIVENVREVIGAITRQIKGEVTLELAFTLLNTDALFGANDNIPMQSGWSGQPLYLAGVKVRVRQGLASFSGTTNAVGMLSLQVAKNSATTVCVETENDFVKLIEFLLTNTVCVKDLGELTSNRSEVIAVKHAYFNVLAQMTDVADYLHTVAGYTMNKITVLVGSWANRLALSDRAFAPCMGRMPNLIVGGGADLLGFLLPAGVVTAAVAEFLYAVDIVLPDADVHSRGVGVHEYGHAVMCDMMARQSLADFQTAWTDVIFASAEQTATNATSYIAEAFADFIASQVVGGTNYFPPTDTASEYESSNSMDYCKASSAGCIDSNFHEQHLPANDNGFRAQVRRVAGILHDAFDGHVLAEDPNDGAHWDKTGSATYVTNILGNTSDLDDEAIALPGPGIMDLFSHWSARAATLSEASFLGALVDTLQAHGYSNSAICDLFKLHAAANTCPSYVPAPGNGSQGGSPVVVSPRPPKLPKPPAEAVCMKKPWTPGCEL